MSLHPDSTFEYRPDGEDGERVLTYQHGTAGDWIRWNEAYQKAADANDLKALARLAQTGLVSVKGVDGYDQGSEMAIADVLTIAELFSLCVNLPHVATMSEFDAKKSLRQSQSDTGSSAATAEGQDAA